MKNTIAVAGLAILVVGCVSSFVGNSPMERKHRKYIQQDESTFVNQSYQRRYAPAIQETEAYFTFTNRLSKRDVEPMDLVNLGKSHCSISRHQHCMADRYDRFCGLQ